MDDVNKVFVSGIIGFEPKGGTSKNGSPWASCSIASQEQGKDKVYTTWVRVSAFGDAAQEILTCKKGDKITVQGKWKNNTYDKEGQKIKQDQVLASKVMKVMLSGPQPDIDETEQYF